MFSGLEIPTGTPAEACRPRPRHQEFLAFRKQVARVYPEGELHLVMDNYAAHKRIEVRDRLAANPCVHVTFRPTSASWLNLLDGRNGRCHPLAWTKTAETILAKADRRTTSATDR